VANASFWYNYYAVLLTATFGSVACERTCTTRGLAPMTLIFFFCTFRDNDLDVFAIACDII
jgi:hypothetical protein